MSFPMYPSYKDSGVEWLGEVPEHWSVTRLKHLATVRTGVAKGKDHGDRATLSVPYLRVANVQDGYLDLEDVSEIEIPVEDLDRYRLQPGDVLMNEGGDFDKLGRGHIWEGQVDPCITQNHVFAVRPFKVDSHWLNLMTSSAFAQTYFTNRSKQSTNLASISSTNLKELPVVLPPPAEQTAILQVTQRETAKIDALVAEQQRLIELLKEKRQAIISHAVTKGLNPDAPMKDSGVEWLGEVPEHWTAKPLKHLATIGNGSTPSRENPEYWAESGFPWLNSSVVNTPLVTEAEGFVTEQALQECHLPIVAPPAVLVGITGQGRTRGMAAMLGIEATINQHVAYVKPSTTNLNVDYILRVLEMSYLKLRQDSEEAGATKGAITCGQIGNLSIPFPPVGEQATIVLFLSDSTAKFDTLTAEAQRAIELLQERRAALISAAVTGQIDVRGLAGEHSA